MAQHERGTILSAQQISRAERIAAPSLAKVMKTLARARIVRPARGRKGGYVLATDPRRLSLWRVMLQFDDPRQYSACAIGLTYCNETNPCPLHAYWKQTRRAIEEFLQRVRISDLAAAAGRAQKAKQPS